MDLGKFQLDVADLAEAFETIDDPRSEVNRRHPLTSVLTIAVMAVLSGAGGPTAIADWANIKSEWLTKLLPLPHGIPQKDVFRRVLMSINPVVFQACFAEWVQQLTAAHQSADEGKPVLSIDGKTLRRSHDRAKGLGALHSVSVWAGDYGLTLAQVACAEKSNEITAIPEVLKLVETKGAIVTIDAMGTQKAIASQIVDGQGDYVLALKGNQGKFHQAVAEYVDAQLENDFQGIGARRHETHETGHGRQEHRLYVQFPVPKELAGQDEWRGLKTIGVAMLTTVRNGTESSDVRYFISSLAMGVKEFARAVRGHWSIENGCHWILDMVYREDESRIRQERLRESFAWLNRFTLSLLKQHPAKKSIAMKRRSCAWNDEFLLQVLTGATG
jgi:predicted transposase YbfD/YdcC